MNDGTTFVRLLPFAWGTTDQLAGRCVSLCQRSIESLSVRRRCCCYSQTQSSSRRTVSVEASQRGSSKVLFGRPANKRKRSEVITEVRRAIIVGAKQRRARGRRGLLSSPEERWYSFCPSVTIRSYVRFQGVHTIFFDAPLPLSLLCSSLTVNQEVVVGRPVLLLLSSSLQPVCLPVFQRNSKLPTP